MSKNNECVYTDYRKSMTGANIRKITNLDPKKLLNSKDRECKHSNHGMYDKYDENDKFNKYGADDKYDFKKNPNGYTNSDTIKHHNNGYECRVNPCCQPLEKKGPTGYTGYTGPAGPQALTYFYTGYTGTTSTTSTSYVIIGAGATELSISVPLGGTYYAELSLSASCDDNNTVATYTLFKNTSIIPTTRRVIQNGINYGYQVHSMATIQANANDIISAQYLLSNGTSTITVSDRQLFLLRLQ